MDTQTAAWWIKHLALQPHPEGGFYKEIFRSRQQVNRAGESAAKQAITSIYYFLEGADFSGFHRIASDELWYFHAGSPLTIHAINSRGEYVAHELSDNAAGSLSVAIEAGLWFAAEISSKTGYSLVSCAVAPGFEFSEFEMANKNEMLARFPQHTALLNRLCR